MIPDNVVYEKDSEIRPMWEAARKLFGTKEVVGVEVGTSSGANMARSLKHWPEITKLYLVDFFPLYSDFMFQEDQSRNLLWLTKNLIAHPKAHFIMAPSVEAAKQFQAESVDFVYIDANHSYTFVRDDIQAWLPKIKKGGIIGGHDYDWTDIAHGDELAVKRAVDEAFGTDGRVNYHINLFTSQSESRMRLEDMERYTGINSDWWVFV